jgi:hypothetical protein
MTGENGDDRTVPKLFDWALSVYDAMHRASTMQEIVEGNPPVRVYEGHLTNLCRDLDMPNPYYTKIMKALKELGCVEQLRRGGGSAMSRWILIKAPESGQFIDRVERQSARNGKVGQLEQRLRDLQKLVINQGERIEAAHERLDHVEEKVHDHEQLSQVVH